MFLLVPAYPGCPGSKAVKRSLVVLLINGCLHSLDSVKCQQKLSWHREGGFDGMQISAFMISLLTFNFVTQLPRFDILVICI